MIVYPMHFRIAKWACDRLTEDAGLFFKKINFSDETDFDLGGYVNRQNCCIWGTKNPHAFIEKPTYTKRVTVWYGFWSRDIIGPFFFENVQGETVTVNRYWAMLNEFLFTKIVSPTQAHFPALFKRIHIRSANG